MENEYTLTVTISVKVKTNLSIEDAIDEFGSECNYDFPSTENVEVVSSQWLDTE
jgi:hypothetical protein